MGDRCDLSLECRKADFPAVAEVFEVDENVIQREEDGIVSILIWEINYGGQTELERLAAKGIPLIGSHTAGSGYGARNLCAIGGEYHEIEVNHDGHYFMAVNERGTPIDKDAKRKIRVFAKAEKRARKALMSG